MKILFAFIAVFLLVLSSTAQTSWTVQLNNKKLLTAIQEDTVANQVTVHDLKKGSLMIRYREPLNKNFGRSIGVYTIDDVELYKKQEKTLIIPVKLLKQWARKAQPVKVYTLMVPLNAATAAVVRLRRVHLCTINFN